MVFQILGLRFHAQGGKKKIAITALDESFPGSRSDAAGALGKYGSAKGRTCFVEGVCGVS